MDFAYQYFSFMRTNEANKWLEQYNLNIQYEKFKYKGGHMSSLPSQIIFSDFIDTAKISETYK